MDSGLLEQSIDGSVEKPRAIIDRRALLAQLEAIFAADVAEREKRAQVLAAARVALEAGRAEVRRRFEAGAGGSATVEANCYLADQLIRVLYDYVTEKVYPLANPSAGERLALVALGGYGRGELAPYSDIDLLFLLPYKMTPRSEQVVEELLYFLWDLSLKVGQAVRSVDECIRLAKSDMVIRTSLLEARWLWGEQALYEELRQRYRREVEGRAPVRFIESKLAERDARHRRLGGSRYALEPNIKEGKGGLRDLHTLFWIAKNLYHVDGIGRLVERGLFTRAEAQRFIKAQNFLWTLRCHMHYLAGRAEERLTFDVQKAIAPLMGFTNHAGLSDVERFMKRYFLVAKDVGSLTRIFCAALEMEHGRGARFRIKAQGLIGRRRRVGGFPVEGDRITVKGPEDFKAEPIKLLRLFQVAQAHDLDVHPKALRWVTQNLKLIDRKAARGPAGQPDLPADADLGEGPGDHPAAAQRSRRLRPLRARLRPGRGADAVQHVPPLHGGRAHDHGDRHPARHRERPPQGGGADRQRGGAQGAVAPGALRRGPAARHRQGPQRRSFRARRRGRGDALPAPGPQRGGDRDRRLAGPLPPGR